MNRPTLRPYQVEAIGGLRSKFRSGLKSIVLVLPTGAGKTTVASEMIRSALEKGSRVLFLAHRKELIMQCCNRLMQFGLMPAVIMNGITPDYSNNLQVASIQTLIRREYDRLNFKLIIVDECHTSVSNSYQQLLQHFSERGALVIGLTATPFRTNKTEGLNKLYQDFVANITISQLISAGYLVPTRVYASGKVSSASFKVQAGEFSDDDMMRAFDTDNVYVNLITNYKRLAAGLKTIIFCVNVAHSKSTVQAFKKEGFAAEHIDGETPKAIRDQAVANFRSGRIQILSNCNILTEGFDVPDCECVVLNMATKSMIKYMQAVGRGLRPAPAKTHCIVIDMSDNTARHGFVEQDIEISLKPKKVKAGGEAPVKECGVKKIDGVYQQVSDVNGLPGCGTMLHASLRQCPHCGYRFPKHIHEIEEELFVEMKKGWDTYKRKDWEKVPTELLSEFAKHKGFHHGWVYHMKRERENLTQN